MREPQCLSAHYKNFHVCHFCPSLLRKVKENWTLRAHLLHQMIHFSHHCGILLRKLLIDIGVG